MVRARSAARSNSQMNLSREKKMNIELPTDYVNQNKPGPEAIVPRQGVVTLFGYGIHARVDRGHLIIEDGIGAAKRHARFSRIGHGLKRLVVIGSDGIVSLAA